MPEKDSGVTFIKCTNVRDNWTWTLLGFDRKGACVVGVVLQKGNLIRIRVYVQRCDKDFIGLASSEIDHGDAGTSEKDVGFDVIYR